MRIASVVLMSFVFVLAASCVQADEPKFDVGDEVEDFTLKAPDGNEVNTEELREDKVFVLKFGATWCPPCNAQVPELNKVVEEYGDKVVVLDVNIREEAEQVAQHHENLGAKFGTVLDSDAAIAQKYDVAGIPVVIVADQEGKIVYRGHYTPFDNLKRVIDPLVEEDEE